MALWNAGALDVFFGPRDLDTSRLDAAQRELEKNPSALKKCQILTGV